MGTQGTRTGPSRSPAATALIPKFIANRRRDVVTIQDSLERRDFEVISRIGHNMQGNGESYGFPDITRLGVSLEAAAESRHVPGVRDVVDSLVAWLDRMGGLGPG
jgi:hypothetical protein